jgi:phosphatidylserine decarboxylase
VHSRRDQYRRGVPDAANSTGRDGRSYGQPVDAIDVRALSDKNAIFAGCKALAQGSPSIRAHRPAVVDPLSTPDLRSSGPIPREFHRMESATARTAARILRMLPRERLTRALGHLTDARVPPAILNPVLRLYTRAYNVDLSEAVLPSAGFETFNQFFTRRLRNGLRPIDADPNSVVSPADGRLDDAGEIDAEQKFVVKGQEYDAGELLGSKPDARRFAGGSYAIVYLSPRDYHRVHSPVEGSITHVRHVPGTLYPVNAFGVRHVPLLFARNERVVIAVDSVRFGHVAVVMVGAMIVGRITLTFEGPERPAFGGAMIERFYGNGSAPHLAKGDELGAFQLGSTVVLLLEPGANSADRILADVIGTHVRVGQAIVQRSAA